MNELLQTVPMDKDPYPNIKDAVMIHERPDMAEIWEVSRNRRYSVDQVIDRLKQCADRTNALYYGDVSLPMIVTRWQEQIDHPEFRQYVAAKLGEM